MRTYFGDNTAFLEVVEHLRLFSNDACRWIATYFHLKTTSITTKPCYRTTLVAHVALAMESGSGFGVSGLFTWLDLPWCVAALLQQTSIKKPRNKTPVSICGDINNRKMHYTQKCILRNYKTGQVWQLGETPSTPFEEEPVNIRDIATSN